MEAPITSTSETSSSQGKDLKYFVNSVKEYSAYGIVPSDTHVGSLTVNHEGTVNFSTYGTDGRMFWDALSLIDPSESPPPPPSSARKFFGLIRAAANDHRTDVNDLARRTHYITLLDPPVNKYRTYEEGTVVFAYGFIQNVSGLDNRGEGLRHSIVGVLVDKDDGVALVEKVKEDPQFLEDFYQQVFPNLDSEKDHLTGICRSKADAVVILDNDAINKIPFIPQYHENEFPADIIKTLPRYNFKEPIGVVDVNN